jgi:hypothetical protein
MKISRRDFLKFCGISAAALGLSTTDIFRLKEALANPNGPAVLWLQGSACTGCSVSFLNRISTTAPLTVADLLTSPTNSINLIYHPNLMGVAGDPVVDELEKAYSRGGYVLAVEGGVPTGFGGGACLAWSHNGQDVTFSPSGPALPSAEFPRRPPIPPGSKVSKPSPAKPRSTSPAVPLIPTGSSGWWPSSFSGIPSGWTRTVGRDLFSVRRFMMNARGKKLKRRRLSGLINSV